MFPSWFPLLLIAAPVPVAGFVVSPPVIEIQHSRSPVSIQVLATTTDGYSADLRTQAIFTIADSRIATVGSDGWVRSVHSGDTQLTVTVGSRSQVIPVRVNVPATEPPTSFRHEVMPWLTQAGCNAGACHGYSLGKNGFRLSLRGQDSDQDYASIVREFGGRRLNRLQPEQSLLVAKAIGDVAHEGGVRFTRGSSSYDTLVRWVSDDAPNDLTDTRQVVSIRTVPDTLVLRPGQTHRVQMLATYSDGSTRDVTRLGVFTTNIPQFAAVDHEGIVTAGDSGETAIVARFERVFAATSVTVLRPGGSFTPSPVPTDNRIDRHVIEKLNRLRITPSKLAGDEEFLRRVHVDLIGVQPSPDEIRAFLADPAPDKRARIVDTLFTRPEYVDHWSLKWGDLLQNSRTVASPQAVFLFREFLRSAIAENLPMDEFARRLLTARGSPTDDPASVYLAISKDTNDTVERTTQVFGGVRMLCARCHAHPLENWTQADYYGVASFFSQMSTRTDTRAPNVPNAKILQVRRAAGYAANPRSGRPQTPKFLGGEVPVLLPDDDRRVTYAAWLTSPDNPFFARSLTNRVWSYFFHRGIIEPVDDVRSTNPPINPMLLDALTADFVDHQFDARHLMRRIVLSQTYQRSSVPNDTNRHDEQNFSHAIPRRVPAEALLDSLVQATGVTENFGGAPAGFRAAQLPDATIESDFLRLFGKPQRMDACECERDNESNMLQALNFLNGKSILARVKNPIARPALLMKQKLTDEQLVTELYLWSLARTPTATERQVGVQYLTGSESDKLSAVQDLMWALLNSRDFLLVH